MDVCEKEREKVSVSAWASADFPGGQKHTICLKNT